MRLIDLKERKPIIEPVALTIKEFKALWDRDKSKGKDKALEEFAALYLICDFQSPYRIYGEEAEKKVKEAVITDKQWKIDDVFKEAMVTYRELQKTPSLGLLEDAEGSIEKLREYYRNINVKDRTGAAAKNLQGNIAGIGPMVIGLGKLREIVEQEQYEQIRIRGKGSLGNRELPPDRRK